MDIGEYILSEYVPAKPLNSNLEVSLGSDELAPPEASAQLRCSDGLKFPFARANHQPRAAAIKERRVIVAEDEATGTKRVVELTLDPGSPFDFQPGDTLAVVPRNSRQLVDRLLKRLELMTSADTCCHVKLIPGCAKKSKVPAHIPQPSSPREIITDCLALNSVPQKQFLSALSGFTCNENEQRFLACLSSKQAAAFYNTIFLEGGLRLPEILELCVTCKPPLAFLAEHLPRLLPRPYSLSNSPMEGDAKELRIIYSVLGKKPGVTTGMLEATDQQCDKIIIYPRLSNSFRFTEEDVCNNQILIAVGTGLAPFLGFLSHKEQLLNQGQRVNLGHTWLYVGAKTTDAIPKLDNLLEWQLSSVLQRLRMCQSHGDFPCYVQQLLEEDSEELVEFLMQSNTVVYVCADGAKISQSIFNGLRQSLQNALHLNEEEAAQKLKDLVPQGKFREDIWA
ncbi:hypothetical protein KR018_008874 [Drosophila ironensis]|nr:hypothetical protein KR018_008874 [Drosophila ironensis]